MFKLNALSHFDHNNYIKLWGFFKAFWPLWTILTINYTSASYSGYVHSHYFNVTQHSHSHSLRTYILTMILSGVLWLFYSSLIFILFLQFMCLWCTFWVLFHKWVGRNWFQFWVSLVCYFKQLFLSLQIPYLYLFRYVCILGRGFQIKEVDSDVFWNGIPDSDISYTAPWFLLNNSTCWDPKRTLFP